MILYIPICIYTYVLPGAYEQLWWVIQVIFISIQYRAVWEPILDNTQVHNTCAYINVKFYTNSVKNV